MGGPCWGSRGGRGKLQCMNRLDDGYAQQSNTESANILTKGSASRVHMLVDQEYANVLPLSCKSHECLFDSSVIRLAIDH